MVLIRAIYRILAIPEVPVDLAQPRDIFTQQTVAAANEWDLPSWSGELSEDRFLEQRPLMPAEAAVAEFLDLHQSDYQKYWDESTDDERFALWQLAEDGIPNWRNTQALRSLGRRGLIIRQPEFRLMNKSLRLFVRETATRDMKEQWRAEARESGWGRMRGAFVTALPLAGVFLLATQQDLLKSSITYITAGVAVLGGIMKLFSSLQGRSSPE